MAKQAYLVSYSYDSKTLGKRVHQTKELLADGPEHAATEAARRLSHLPRLIVLRVDRIAGAARA